MGDKIYEDSIVVSAGRFTIRTNQGPGSSTGRAIILNKPLHARSTMRFGSLTRADLLDLHAIIGEYLHMSGLSDD